MRWTTTNLVLALLATLPLVAFPGSAQAPEERAVLATVERLFAGMRAADPEVTRSVLSTDARFAMISSAGAVAVESMGGWLTAIGTSEGRWDERVYDVEVRVDGSMASVWAPYTFYLDGAVLHCGVNSIELLRGVSGWRITQLSDTRRMEGCPDPARGGSTQR